MAQLARSVEKHRECPAREAAGAGLCLRKTCSKLNLPVLRWLAAQTSADDRALPDLLSAGLPIVGEALRSPFFWVVDVPPRISTTHFLAIAPARKKLLANNALHEGRRDRAGAARMCFDKTVEKVARGRMSDAMTEDEVTSKHGRHWNAMRRFALRQGMDVHGKPKFRVIDDHTECFNNEAELRTRKMEMSGVPWPPGWSSGPVVMSAI